MFWNLRQEFVAKPLNKNEAKLLKGEYATLHVIFSMSLKLDPGVVRIGAVCF